MASAITAQTRLKRPSVGETDGVPTLQVAGEWQELLRGRQRARLEEILPDFLQQQRWYRAKSHTIRNVRLAELITLEAGDELGEARFQLVTVDFVDADAETYLLPLAFATGERAGRIADQHARAIVARLTTASGQGVLFDALVEPHIGERLLALIARNERRPADEGEVVGRRGAAFERILEHTIGRDAGEDDTDAVGVGEGDELLPWSRLRASIGRAEQSNTSVNFGDTLILKIYRKVEDGINQDVEVGEFLTRTGFEHAPRVAGTLSLRRGRREPVVLGLLQEYVPNEGDAWSYTLDTLAEYFERGLAEQPELPDVTVTVAYLLELAEQLEPDERALEMVGSYLQSAETMGERTAQMHRALVAPAGGDADFQPEAFSTLYQRSLYQSMRNLAGRVLQALAARVDTLALTPHGFYWFELTTPRTRDPAGISTRSS